MIRTTTLLLAVALALAPVSKATVAADSLSWLTEIEAAVDASRSSGRPILVDLYADWCGWCKRLDEEVFSSEIFASVAPRFVLLRVDTEDGGQGTALAERFGVTSLPTTLVITADLVRIGEIRGFAPAEGYVGRIQEEIRRAAELEGRVRAAADSLDIDELLDLADALHERRDPRAANLYGRVLDIPDAPQDRLRLRYLMADALRLGGRFEEAETVVDTLRHDLTAGPLAEQADLLRFRIARDRGACDDAIGALESFLDTHPESILRAYATEALDQLRHGGDALCT